MTPQPKFVLLSIFLLFSVLPTAWAEDTAEAEEETTEESGITDYISMEPAFVTHVGSPGGKLTYLKAAVTLRASRQTTRTDTDKLTTLEGQQTLREEAKSRINGVLEEQQTGEAITGVLFTEFVVQK